MVQTPTRLHPTLATEAIRALHARHAERLAKVCRLYGLTPPDVDDVLQTVFLRLIESVLEIRDGARLAGWLTTTTHRECWRVARRNRRRGLSLEALGVDRAAFATDLLLERERSVLLDRALKSMGERCELLLRSLFLDASNPDYREIAIRLGIGLNSVGPARTRCCRRLAALLDELDFFESRTDPRRWCIRMRERLPRILRAIPAIPT